MAKRVITRKRSQRKAGAGEFEFEPTAVEAILTRAFPQAEFIAAAVSSGIPEQPWGDEKTRRGAYNRAGAVLKQTEADLGVGLLLI